MELNELSVVYNAAKALSATRSGESNPETEIITGIQEKLYGESNIPYLLNEGFPVALHLFSPRLRNLLETDKFSAQRLWSFISSRDNIIRMMTATEMDRPAAEGLSGRFENYYEGKPEERDEVVQFKQIIGYMIKVVMELFGYRVARKRVLISTISAGNPDGKKRYFTTASRYKKMNEGDIEDLCGKIENEDTREAFCEVMNCIVNTRTIYQDNYGIDELRD